MSNKKNAITYNADYDEASGIWKLVRDCVKGDQAIKDSGTEYLPKPCALDNSEKGNSKYNEYKDRAYFLNATRRTKTSLLGAAYFRPPKIALVSSMDYFNDNSDGNGLGIIQKSKEITGELIEVGRYGILVDFPRVENEQGETTSLDTENGIRPFFASYKAESIVDWTRRSFGGINKLSAVKLIEHNNECDEFGFSIGKSYSVERVLFLDEEGVYRQKVKDLRNGYEEIITPLDGNGTPLTYIPFVFFGSENNDETIDDSILYDIAVVNIGHYRNSADYEDSSHKVGQPTLVVKTGMDEDQLDSTEMVFGSGVAIVLDAEDDAKLVQAAPNSMPREAMNSKLEEMKTIGARLITPSKQQTAEAARIEQGTDTSVLSTITENVSEGITVCLDYAEQFMTGEITDSNVFAMSEEFFFTTMSAQDRAAWASDIMAGNVALEDYWDALRESKLISKERTNEDIADDIETQIPAQLPNFDASDNQEGS